MIKINGQTHVKRVKKHLQEELGVMVDILDKQGKAQAPDNIPFASLYPKKRRPKSSVFTIPHGSTYVGTIEKGFKNHYGVNIKILNLEGEPANEKEKYEVLRRSFAQAFGELPPISKWLDDEMHKKETTDESLAEKTGLSAFTIRNIRFGDTQNPQEETLKKIEKALGVPLPQETKEAAKEDAEITGLGELIDFDPRSEELPPKVAGIYVLYDVTGRPIYIGQSTNCIRARIKDHRKRKWFIEDVVEKGTYVGIEDTELIPKIETLLIRVLKSRVVFNKKCADRV